MPTSTSDPNVFVCSRCGQKAVGNYYAAINHEIANLVFVVNSRIIISSHFSRASRAHEYIWVGNTSRDPASGDGEDGTFVLPKKKTVRLRYARKSGGGDHGRFNPMVELLTWGTGDSTGSTKETKKYESFKHEFCSNSDLAKLRPKDLFHNNKDARVTQLDNEIPNMTIGSLSVTDLFQEIKSKVYRLANLDSPVKDTSLVTYYVNGIRSKYPDATRVIRLREKAPTFDVLRSMMLLEESDMSHQSVSSTLLHNTPSSPTVLVASTTPTDRANTMSTSGFDDYQTHRLLLRCDSTSDLYPVTHQPLSSTPFALISLSLTTWHRRLGHPGEDVLRHLESSRFISCHKTKLSALCHACQLGKHTRLLFYSSESNVAFVFDNVHSDLWTSPISIESACVFLGYPALHRGYRCLDLSTNKIIISRHVIFDEDQFPFGSMTPDQPPSYDFLLPPPNTQVTNPPNHHLSTGKPTPSIHIPTQPYPSQLHSTPHLDPANEPVTLTKPTTPDPTPVPTSPSPTPNTHLTTPAATTSSNAPNGPTTNTHHIVTRAKAGISKPLARMNCHVTTTSPIPRSHLHVLRDPHWHKDMVDEYNALISNGTWALMPRPVNVNVVRPMWLFRHKYNADGSLSRYKARLVANGHTQQQGIDCDETFSTVVKPNTIHIVSSLVVIRDWPIHQLDVKNAFLHGQLSKTVYMYQPPGFVDSTHPDYVYHLQRSLYGLKQAPRAWFHRFASFITHVGFKHSKTDMSLFVYHQGLDIAYLILYVDDIVLTASSTVLLDPTLYRSLAGALQYLTFTRPDISYAVQQICLYMHDPRDPHFNALKCILRYVCGTLDHDLHLHVLSASQLTAFTVAEWAGFPVTRRSTSGLRMLLVCQATGHVHQRTKHIEIDIHFVRDYVASGQVRVLHVSSRFQYVDIFTKGLLTALFLEFRSGLNVRRSPVPTAREY
nr:ribonuclease H-like domain-containing protein [Tanacetum cinerariifolium]